jgi:hypothetical protein
MYRVPDGQAKKGAEAAMEKERIERLQTFVAEGRIVRDYWTGIDKQGREEACLLAALSPEAGKAEDAGACPASVMPTWFAYMTPWMDDNASEAEWPRMVRRYAACAARWSALDNAAWRRIEVVALRTAVVEAMRHITDAQASAILTQVLAWIDAGMSEPEREALQAAALKAQGEREPGEAWWESEMHNAANVASAATRIVDAPLYTAALAAETAGMAVEAATGTAAGLAAAKSATDRMTDTVLSALERECGI